MQHDQSPGDAEHCGNIANPVLTQVSQEDSAKLDLHVQILRW